MSLVHRNAKDPSMDTMWSTYSVPEQTAWHWGTCLSELQRTFSQLRNDRSSVSDDVVQNDVNSGGKESSALCCCWTCPKNHELHAQMPQNLRQSATQPFGCVEDTKPTPKWLGGANFEAQLHCPHPSHTDQISKCLPPTNGEPASGVANFLNSVWRLQAHTFVIANCAPQLTAMIHSQAVTGGFGTSHEPSAICEDQSCCAATNIPPAGRSHKQHHSPRRDPCASKDLPIDLPDLAQLCEVDGAVERSRYFAQSLKGEQLEASQVELLPQNRPSSQEWCVGGRPSPPIRMPHEDATRLLSSRSAFTDVQRDVSSHLRCLIKKHGALDEASPISFPSKTDCWAKYTEDTISDINLAVDLDTSKAKDICVSRLKRP